MIRVIFKGTVYEVSKSESSKFITMKPKYSTKDTIRVEAEVFRSMHRNNMFDLMSDDGEAIKWQE